MKIVEIGGEHIAREIQDLEAILLQRREPDGNAFWLAQDGEEYPMLSLLVKGNIAALDFLESGDDPGVRSIGRLPDVNSNQNTVFRISTNRADDLEVQNDALVSFTTALAAAKEFFVSGRRPQCIEWLEL